MKIFGIIAHPVEHSLSPIFQDAAFRHLGILAEYRAFDVKSKDLGEFMKVLFKENIYGLNVSTPHKEAIMRYIEPDKIALQIGAINTIYRENDHFYGTNTDYIGITEPLKKITNLKGKKVMILGAGGAAKAACYGLKKEGADITIVNRTHEKAVFLAEKFDINASEKPIDAEIIINCTPDGLVSPEIFKYTQIAFDVVYSKETPFTLHAHESGAIVIDGIEMLLHQGFASFEKWTGKKAPREVMREAIQKNHSPSHPSS